MRKTVLIFGLIIGVLFTANLVWMIHLMYNRPDFKANDIVGYASMIVVFSLVFAGVRDYRNRRLAGVISFWKAFKTGALIAFIASTMYVVAWLFMYYLWVPDFIEKYGEHVMNNCVRDGATAQELAEKSEEIDGYRQMYKNPVWVVLLTYMEVLPIGLLVALISALVLKRKAKKVPETTGTV
ncbi:MAG: DUF4199 domain-containing protein [Bacteroidia bacterium]|nr:DUF4199 domain-containing protein [Bacteroidia bacterium]